MIRHLRAELLDDVGAVLGEGPSWDARTGELVWVDILSGRVHVHDADGRARVTFDVGGHVSSVLPAHRGGWLLTTADGFSLLGADGSVMPLLTVHDRPELRFNDAKCDPWGQALAGTMRYDEMPGSGTLYRLEAGGRVPGATLTVRVLQEPVGLANGLAWTADGATLYFVDSLARSVVGHAYSPQGDLGPARPVVAVDPAEGVPDGMCIDDDGRLWVALHGGGAVHCFRPDGRLDTVVSLPVAYPTSVAFGGDDGGRLFITSRGGAGRAGEGRGPGNGMGGLWAVDPGATGAPAILWRDPTIGKGRLHG
jgi:sugar lactone lactonase YvrE